MSDEPDLLPYSVRRRPRPEHNGKLPQDCSIDEDINGVVEGALRQGSYAVTVSLGFEGFKGNRR